MIFGQRRDDERAIDYAGWKGRIKRDLGRGTTVVLHGESYKVVDLVATLENMCVCGWRMRPFTALWITLWSPFPRSMARRSVMS